MYRPESGGARAAARRRDQVGFGAAKTRETPSAFAFDQGLEGFAHETGFFLQTGKSLGCLQQVIIERKGCAHAASPIEARDYHRLMWKSMLGCIPGLAAFGLVDAGDVLWVGGKSKDLI
jgi:hypothetical protein